MSVEISMDYSQLNNGKMNLQKLVERYEARNKSRMERKFKLQSKTFTLNTSNRNRRVYSRFIKIENKK